MNHLWMEEDLGAQEAFVTDIDTERLLGDGVDALKLLHPLVGFRVVLGKLFGNIGADVAEALLDGFGRFQRLLGWDSDLALPQQRLDEVGDVATGNRDVLDAASDHITFGLNRTGKIHQFLSIDCRDSLTMVYHWYDVGDTVTAVYHDARQSPFAQLSRGPRSGQSQHRLNGNVETGDVERFKHDFCRVFPIFRRVERRFGEEEMMIFGLGSEVLEYTLLQETLHEIPIFHYSVPNWVLMT